MSDMRHQRQHREKAAAPLGAAASGIKCENGMASIALYDARSTGPVNCLF